MERRMETDPGLLEKPVRGQSRGAAQLSQARDNRLAIHPPRAGPDASVAGRVLARQFLYVAARGGRGAARPDGRLQEQRRALSDLPAIFPHPQADVTGGVE